MHPPHSAQSDQFGDFGEKPGHIFGLNDNIGLASIGQFVLHVIINAIIYYFVLISRFPDEAPLAASVSGAPPMYPPQQPPGGSPPQQPPGGYPPQQG